MVAAVHRSSWLLAPRKQIPANSHKLEYKYTTGLQAEQHVPNPNATHLGILMDDAAIDLVLSLVDDLQRQTPFSKSVAGAEPSHRGGGIFGRITRAFAAAE